MAAAAHNPAFAKKAGIPVSVAKEFNQADKGKTFGVGENKKAKLNNPNPDRGQAAFFKKGGEMKESKAMAKKEIAFMEKKGAPKSMIKHEKAEYGMKKGGMAGCKEVAKKEVKGHEKRMHGMAKGGVAKTVTKEMEYDYKTGKKSFGGTTAQRDRHAEKEGKIVAKHAAFDKAKGMRKGGKCMANGGYVRAADGVAQKGKTKGTMVKMCSGGMA